MALAWVLAGIIAFIFLVYMLLRIPAVQNYISTRVTDYVEGETGAKIKLAEILIDFPKTVTLHRLYVGDAQDDTLFFAGSVEINLSLWGLLWNNIHVDRFSLENSTINLVRSLPDSSFNFQFLLDSLSGQEERPPNAGRKSPDLSVGTVELQDVRFSYTDGVSGTDIMSHTGSLAIKMGKIDLKDLLFEVTSLDYRNSYTRLEIKGSESPEDKSAGTLPEVRAGNLQLENIRFEMLNKPSDSEMDLDLGMLKIETKKSSLRQQFIDLESLRLRDTKFTFTYTSVANARANGKKPADSAQQLIPWDIEASNIIIDDLDLDLVNHGTPRQERGIDYGHLEVDDLELSARDVNLSGESISAQLMSLALEERSGLKLNNLEANAYLGSNEATLNDLRIKTGKSNLSGDLRITFASPGKIAGNPGNLHADISLTNTQISPVEVELFAPGIFEGVPLKLRENGPVSITAELKGKLSDLAVGLLDVSWADSTRARISGNVTGLPETGNLHADIKIDELRTARSDLFRILPDTMLPEGIHIPEFIALQGTLNGNLKDIDASASLKSSLGALSANLRLYWNEQNIPFYEGKFRTDTLDVGTLLEMPETIGKAGILADFKGDHFDPALLSAEASVEMPFFQMNGYTYQNTDLELSADSGTFEASGSMNDEYIELVMEGVYVHDIVKPEINLTLNLEAANLQELNLSEEDIRVKGILVADLKGSNTENLTGKLQTKEVLIIKDGNLYPVDSLIFIAFNDTTRTDIRLESDILDARIEANKRFTKLIPSFKGHLNQYFPLDSDGSMVADTSLRIDFEADLKSSQLLKEVFVPGIQALETGQIKGSVEGAGMELNIDVPLFIYSGFEINDLGIAVQADRKSLEAEVLLKRIEAAGLQTDSLALSATAQNDTLYTEFKIRNGEGDAQYLFTSRLTFEDTAYRLFFPRDQMILDYEEWEIPGQRQVLLGDFPAKRKSLSFENDDESVTINTEAGLFTIGFENFRLDNLARIVETSTGASLISGRMTGNIGIAEHPEGIVFRTDLKVDSTAVLGEPLGNLSILSKQEEPGIFSAEVEVRGPNRLTAEIARLPFNTGGEIDITAGIDEFKLATLGPLLEPETDSLSGALQGSIKVINTAEDPRLSGELEFVDASAVVVPLGSRLTIPGTTLEIKDNNLAFHDFTLLDREGNELTLNGGIRTDSLRTFRLDLNMVADNFKAMDQPEQQGRFAYGRLIFSTDTDITGTISQPTIRARVIIEENTDLKLNIQQASPSTVEREGIVEFIDKDRKLDSILIEDHGGEVFFEPSGIDFDANIETKEGAQFELIIDEKAGDRLRVQGSSDLSLSLDETGELTLTGRYNVSDGDYRLILFGINRREFMIREGSYLYWTGEPLQAVMHINAVYNVRTAPINLISNQTTDAGSPEFSKYRQKLPFRVNLFIRGDLLSPDISFSIELPPDLRNIYQGTVQAKLQQLNQPGNESNLNKQVLSLLVFNQFMPQNPLEMEGGGISSTARRSASKLLSRQLNIFAEKYIQGFNLTFDVRSYEEYGEEGPPEGRTELGVNLSKSFLDDRLEVRVGGNVELESEEHREITGFNDIAGDIELIYKLTENGIYRVKAFRLTEYEQFEGSIVESGAALIFTRRFNHIRNLFRSGEKEKKE